MEGHLFSNFINLKEIKYPFLCLLVSGGHTQIWNVKKYRDYNLISNTIDDAAGEAFDKVARLLGLPYPGGPSIQKAAEFGNPKRFCLPKGRVSIPGGGFYPYDFSFSGLKTAMLRQVEELRKNQLNIPIADLAASFEAIVVEVLVERTMKCILDNRLKDLVMVGGVAANKRLREAMAVASLTHGINLRLASKAFCTDNAAMIGAAAIMRLESGLTASSLELGVKPRMPLVEASLLYQNPPPF